MLKALESVHIEPCCPESGCSVMWLNGDSFDIPYM